MITVIILLGGFKLTTDDWVHHCVFVTYIGTYLLFNILGRWVVFDSPLYKLNLAEKKIAVTILIGGFKLTNDDCVHHCVFVTYIGTYLI